ncbi:MAG: polymer-forming cytoskeletal protein [Flavobacteriales bacterium]|nr:polymer-forming cytoskeletal protein [Flavobacteriales bacterium]
MIGNKKSPMGMDAPSTDAVNRIVEGTTFEGNIRSQSNMRVDGTFEGDITTKGRLVVGPKGSIKGNVMCAHCEVEGSMEGQIEVVELMALKASAKVAGTVYSASSAWKPVPNPWERSTWEAASARTFP